MKRVVVAWRPAAGRFEAVGGHADFPIAVNAPHGEGPATGFSAAELLLAGCAACSAWDVVEILRKARQPLVGLEVEAVGTQMDERPFAFIGVELIYRAQGPRLDRRRVEHAVHLSVERYCSVINTITGVATVTTRVELDEVTDPAATVA
ncbi:MAG TPA: OsmC family protein [Candidatus Limnocylindrales bacterium]|nr:OsmC family protein [Candidatus Limnocylindrales bacterium]